MNTTTKTKISYREKLLDPRWQRMRLEVLERDNWTCRCCAATTKTLHAHHTYYTAGVAGPWDYPSSSIITLCDECHEVEHEDFYGTRTRATVSVIDAGFHLADQLEWFAATFEGAVPMDRLDCARFLATIRAALRSQGGRSIGVDDGELWEKFVAIGKAE